VFVGVAVTVGVGDGDKVPVGVFVTVGVFVIVGVLVGVFVGLFQPIALLGDWPKKIAPKNMMLKITKVSFLIFNAPFNFS